MATSADLSKPPLVRLVDQIKVSGGGVVASMVVIPFVVKSWTPAWFPITWSGLYFAQSVLFLLVIAFRPSPRAWQAWAISTATLFASICGAVMVWGADHPSAPWIASMIAIAYISFEVAVLPYLEIPTWWLGTTTVGVALTVMAATVINPFLVIGVIPLLVSMTLTAGRNKQMSDTLDERLTHAERMVGTDPLTGLLNRRGLEAELASLDGADVTLAIFDADRFKQINDTQGHGVGDQVLVTIARHLRTTLSPEWRIARHGGDEFVAVAHSDTLLDLEVVAPLQMPLADRQGQVNVTLSAGVATGRLTDTGDRLLSEAGHALRHAKREGQPLVKSEGVLQERFDRSVALTSLDQADSPIVPVTQVIVNDHGVVGCEMLARWRIPDGTLLSPAQFMDMLTENGLLGQLDDVMLEHAVKLAARLQQPEFRDQGIDLFVSANVAASHLLDVELPGRVSRLLAEHGVSPERLMIEITESERLGKDRVWEGAVQGLRDLGVMLAIDDFGAGYSSVARLRHLPITHLKLDMSMVQGASGPLGAIVRGVTQFCLDSDIGVIAEGIESDADHQTMRTLGVDAFQGYLFGRPMRIDDFLRDVVERNAAASRPADALVDSLGDEVSVSDVEVAHVAVESQQ